MYQISDHKLCSISTALRSALYAAMGATLSKTTKTRFSTSELCESLTSVFEPFVKTIGFNPVEMLQALAGHDLNKVIHLEHLDSFVLTLADSITQRVVNEAIVPNSWVEETAQTNIRIIPNDPQTTITPSDSPVLDSQHFLKAALAVQIERGQNYDQEGGERSIDKLVAVFNTLYGTNLTPAQGWAFLALLKMVRMESAPQPHYDSALDAVSYLALMAESYMSPSKKSTV